MNKSSSYLPLQLGDLFIYGLKSWRKQEEETGTSRTIVAGDNGLSICSTNASLCTVTIPNGLALTDFEVEFEICAYGAAGVSIEVSGGATINGATSAIAVSQYGGATIRKIGTDAYVVHGV